MATSPSFDKRPVYLNKLGAPLRPGSQLRYYLVGTNTPKTVYSDYQGTVSAAWPQIINSESRTDNQIFIKNGDATVISWEILEGIDPLTAAWPDDYSLDNQWVDQDMAVSTVAANASAYGVDTIATLRTLNPTALGFAEFDVAGYYAAGDAPVRRYHWDPISISSDNGGTIIKNPNIATGRFVLRVEGPVYDVRTSGIMPGKTDLSVNGLMSALQSSLSALAKVPTTVYFPPGVYTVDPGTMTWTSPVLLDQWVTFNVASAGTFNLEFSSKWEILTKYPLQNATSTGTLNPVFSYPDQSIPVNLRWWGAAYTGAYNTGEGNALRTAAANTNAIHPIIIDEPYLVDASLAGSFTVYNTLIFEHNGVIKNSQLGHTFDMTDVINNRIDQNPCLNFDGTGSLYIANGYPIKASWFGQAQAFDAGPGLAHMNITSQRGTRVLLDKDLYIENTVSPYADTAFQHLVWVPQGGVLTVTGDNSTIHIAYIDYTEKRVFNADPVGIAVDSGVITPMMWYDRDQNSDLAFRAALWATLNGRFDTTLDLAGHTWSVTNQVTSNNSYNKSSTIRNGTISSTSAYPIIDIYSGATFRLSTEKVTYNGSTSWIKVEYGATLVNAYITDSAISSGTGNVVEIVGALYNIYAKSSNLTGSFIVNGNVWTDLHLTDCYITGGMATMAPSIKVKGCTVNNFNSGTTNWYLRAKGNNVTGNEFNGVNVGILPYNVYSTNIISGTITGNTFNFINDTYGTAILYANADVAGTILTGFVVVGNTWYAANLPGGALIKTIQAVVTGAGSYNSSGYYHQCKVASNSGVETSTTMGNSRIFVPSTVLQSSFAATDIVSGGAPTSVVVTLPPAAFVVPDTSPTIAFGTANGVYSTGGLEYIPYLCSNGPANGQMTVSFSGEYSGTPSVATNIMCSYTLYGNGG